MKHLNVLIPSDFSDVSYLALEMASVLAKKLPVQLHVLHVIEVNDADPGYSEDLENEEVGRKKSEALRRFTELKSRAGSFQAHVRVGKLTDQINLAAEQLSAGLVIMGTKGSDGFMEAISGSEAQHVARYLHVPVLSVRPGTLMQGLKNILLVADFEHVGGAVQVETIKLLAAAFDSTIHLLQILRKGDDKHSLDIEARMNGFAKEQKLIKYETHLYHDQKVEQGVRNFNRESEMDLVSIGTHGRKGINHLFFGSIAERLVNHCIKPLLTFQLR